MHYSYLLSLWLPSICRTLHSAHCTVHCSIGNLHLKGSYHSFLWISSSHRLPDPVFLYFEASCEKVSPHWFVATVFELWCDFRNNIIQFLVWNWNKNFWWKGCLGSWGISRICVRFRFTSLPSTFVKMYDRATSWTFSFISAGSRLCVVASYWMLIRYYCMLIFWPEFNAGSSLVFLSW